MERTIDLLVIGGGPAGGAVATPCREAGLSVAMVEKRGYGGVCPLRGCNPKKVLLGPAELRDAVEHLAPHGLRGQLSIDWPTLMAYKHSFTDPIPDLAQQAYAKRGIETLHGDALFLDTNRVQVGDDILTADTIAICCGRVPRPLSFPGAEHLLTSDDFLDLPAMPPRVACIGGGFVAMELMSIAHRAGASVHMLHRSERLLRGFDLDLVNQLVGASRERGMVIHCHASVTAIEECHTGLKVTYTHHDSTQTIEVDAIFNFAGRMADVETLNLEAAGVTGDSAGIPVSGTMQTNQAHIFALGDCAATPWNLTPAASLEGEVASHNILARIRHHAMQEADYTGLPSACFSIPPIASVGLSEEEAKAQGIDVTVKTTDLADSFPWKRLAESPGHAKVLVDEAGDRLLGAHILGHNAEEMINLFALAIRAQVPLATLRGPYWAYPTCGYYMKYMA